MITGATESDRAWLRMADRLDRWARETVNGGWSQQHVQIQREVAAKIRNAVVTGDFSAL